MFWDCSCGLGVGVLGLMRFGGEDWEGKFSHGITRDFTGLGVGCVFVVRLSLNSLDLLFCYDC